MRACVRAHELHKSPQRLLFREISPVKHINLLPHDRLQERRGMYACMCMCMHQHEGIGERASERACEQERERERWSEGGRERESARASERTMERDCVHSYGKAHKRHQSRVVGVAGLLHHRRKDAISKERVELFADLACHICCVVFVAAIVQTIAPHLHTHSVCVCARARAHARARVSCVFGRLPNCLLCARVREGVSLSLSLSLTHTHTHAHTLSLYLSLCVIADTQPANAHHQQHLNATNAAHMRVYVVEHGL